MKGRLTVVRFANILDQVRTRTRHNVQVQVHGSGRTGPQLRSRFNTLGEPEPEVRTRTLGVLLYHLTAAPIDLQSAI